MFSTPEPSVHVLDKNREISVDGTVWFCYYFRLLPDVFWVQILRQYTWILIFHLLAVDKSLKARITIKPNAAAAAAKRGALSDTMVVVYSSSQSWFSTALPTCKWTPSSLLMPARPPACPPASDKPRMKYMQVRIIALTELSCCRTTKVRECPYVFLFPFRL